MEAKPDGYTLGLGTIGESHRAATPDEAPYGGPDTYAPVAKLVSYPNVLMVKAGAPWTGLEEFLNYARAHAGQVTIGVPGIATVAHLNVEQLKRLANVDLKVVVLRRSTPEYGCDPRADRRGSCRTRISYAAHESG